MTFNRFSFINCLKELIGLGLYHDGKKYFYAWNANEALKKEQTGTLYLINDYGERIDVRLNSLTKDR